MSINMNLLNAFVAVAETLSFRRAAEQMHRSQAAVSTQIKELESQLSVSLFHRTTRNVELTREGEQLLVHVRRSLGELEDGLKILRERVQLLQGRLVIACIPTYAATRLPKQLANFQDRYPGISVEVREMFASAIGAAVGHREVDFGISVRPESPQGSLFRTICRDRALALIPAKFPLPDTETVTMEQLATSPLLRLSAETLFRKNIDAALARKKILIPRRHEVSQVTTLIAMAEAGLGVAILPEISAPESTSCRIARIRPAIHRELGILTRRGESLSPAAAELIEALATPVSR